MKVVLLQDIPGKGKSGELKEVTKGYAKNFLLPRGLAMVATPTVIKQVESRLEREKLEESVDQDKLGELAQQIEGREICVKTRVGTGERLFGSITGADIAEELSRVIGSVIDKRKIDIEKPLRQAGSYEIDVKLASDLKPKITVVIEEEKETKKKEKEEKKTERKEEKKVEKKQEKKTEKKEVKKAEKKEVEKAEKKEVEKAEKKENEEEKD